MKTTSSKFSDGNHLVVAKIFASIKALFLAGHLGFQSPSFWVSATDSTSLSKSGLHCLLRNQGYRKNRKPRSHGCWEIAFVDGHCPHKFEKPVLATSPLPVAYQRRWIKLHRVTWIRLVSGLTSPVSELLQSSHIAATQTVTQKHGFWGKVLNSCWTRICMVLRQEDMNEQNHTRTAYQKAIEKTAVKDLVEWSHHRVQLLYLWR